jgi:hypothetical protein
MQKEAEESLEKTRVNNDNDNDRNIMYAIDQ